MTYVSEDYEYIAYRMNMIENTKRKAQGRLPVEGTEPVEYKMSIDWRALTYSDDESFAAIPVTDDELTVTLTFDDDMDNYLKSFL